MNIIPLIIWFLLMFFDGNSMRDITLEEFDVDFSSHIQMLREYYDVIYSKYEQYIENTKPNSLYLILFGIYFVFYVIYCLKLCDVNSAFKYSALLDVDFNLASFTISYLPKIRGFWNLINSIFNYPIEEDDVSDNINKGLEIEFTHLCTVNRNTPTFVDMSCLMCSLIYLREERLYSPTISDSIMIYGAIFLICMSQFGFLIFSIISYKSSLGYRRSFFYFNTGADLFTSIVTIDDDLEKIDKVEKISLRIDEYRLPDTNLPNITNEERALVYDFYTAMMLGQFEEAMNYLNNCDNAELVDFLKHNLQDDEYVLLKDIQFSLYKRGMSCVKNGNVYYIFSNNGLIVEVRGDSGTGKSTILDLLFGNRPWNSALINDIISSKIDPKSKKLYPSFSSSYNYFLQYMTLRDNFSFVNGDMPNLSEWFDDFGMSKYLHQFDRLICEIAFSMGQRCRMDLIRFFVSLEELLKTNDADAFTVAYMDEPCGPLDKKNGHIVMNSAFEISQENNVTFVVVDHSGITSHYADIQLDTNYDNTLTYWIKISDEEEGVKFVRIEDLLATEDSIKVGRLTISKSVFNGNNMYPQEDYKYDKDNISEASTEISIEDNDI